MPTDRIGSLDTARIAKIMTVALEEFSKQSYHQASYNRIIRASGISKGTMYYYFHSKEDLFLTLLTATTKEFHNLSRLISTPQDPDQFWRQTENLVRTLLERLQAKPIIGKFVQGFLTTESRRQQNPAQSTLAKLDEWLQDYILTGQLLGAVRRDLPTELLLKLSWSTWEAFVQWMREGDLSYPPHEAAQILCELWQRCLRLDASFLQVQDEPVLAEEVKAYTSWQQTKSK